MPIYITDKGTRYRKMGLNITHTINNFQFESKDDLQRNAKNILMRKGASEESAKAIVDDLIFSSDSYNKSQTSIIKASVQIDNNITLKETLNYIKNNFKKSFKKEPVFGELWARLNKIKEENSYENEILFEIDYSEKNIFAA